MFTERGWGTCNIKGEEISPFQVQDRKGDHLPYHSELTAGKTKTNIKQQSRFTSWFGVYVHPLPIVSGLLEGGSYVFFMDGSSALNTVLMC